MDIILDRIIKSYQDIEGKKFKLNIYKLKIGKGINAVIGPNGSGKTTLFSLISSSRKPDSGKIIFNKEKLLNQNEKYLHYLPESFEMLNSFNALDNILMLAELNGIEAKVAESLFYELTNDFDFDFKNKKIQKMSKGMKQILGIIYILMHKKGLFIFDEPFSGLDMKRKEIFKNKLTTLGKNNLVLISSHDINDIENISNRIVILKNGEIVENLKKNDFDGNLKEIFLSYF